MLKPSVQIHNVDGLMVAEFWDCFRLDPAPVQELRKMFENHIAAKGRPELVIDLLGVGFAGSAALGNFMAMHRLAKQRGGGLIFCNVDPTVFEVFRVSKLDPLFEFTPDRASALKLATDPKPSATATANGAPADGTLQAAPRPETPRKTGGDGLISASRRRKLSS
jgi:anti-anti-sigma factor